jgi:hypothetical protein
MIAHDSPRGILDLLHQPCAGGPPRAKRHICLEDIALERIGFANDSGFGDRRVMQDCAFDFEWSDAVSGTLDDIVGAALEPEVSSLVTSREIAREKVDACAPDLSSNRGRNSPGRSGAAPDNPPLRAAAQARRHR